MASWWMKYLYEHRSGSSPDSYLIVGLPFVIRSIRETTFCVSYEVFYWTTDILLLISILNIHNRHFNPHFFHFSLFILIVALTYSYRRISLIKEFHILVLYHRLIPAKNKNILYFLHYSLSSSCAIWLWNMVSYIKEGMQAKGIWKQDPEVNIWDQDGWDWGVEKAPQWGTS